MILTWCLSVKTGNVVSQPKRGLFGGYKHPYHRQPRRAVAVARYNKVGDCGDSDTGARCSVNQLCSNRSLSTSIIYFQCAGGAVLSLLPTVCTFPTSGTHVIWGNRAIMLCWMSFTALTSFPFSSLWFCQAKTPQQLLAQANRLVKRTRRKQEELEKLGINYSVPEVALPPLKSKHIVF